jgi:beta-lactamase regulating signal transducer with metallopeptidase domain
MTIVLESTFRISLLLGFALLVVVVLRNRSAALRHCVLTAVVAAAAIIPLLHVIVPAWELEALRLPLATRIEPVPFEIPTTGDSTSRTQPELITGGPTPTTASEAREAEVTTKDFAASASSSKEPFDITRLLTGIWIAGMLAGFLFLIAGALRMAWIASRSRIVSAGPWALIADDVSRAYGMRRKSRLFMTSHPAILATWGVLRPGILLPARADGWSEDRIRIVLSHEFAHIRRYDWLVQISAGVLRALYWFNPLVWIVYARLCRESEQACDDAVLAAGTAGPEYAAHLLAVARALNVAGPTWAPGLLMARTSTLQQRISAMLNPKLNRRRLSRASMLLIVATFIGIAMPVAAVRGASARPAPSTGVRPSSSAPALASAVASFISPPSPQLLQSTPSSTASVEGIVVREGTNEPLSGIMVEMRRIAPGAVLARPFEAAQITSVVTKSDGRFVFRDLQPADYRLVASREDGAFATVEYLQKPKQLLGVAFPLTAGQALKDVRLQMSATGSISGRVVDREGEPVGYARVMALQHWYERGTKMMSLVQVALTNDRGEYRLYWLPAGQYFIAVRPESADVRQSRTLPNVVNIASPMGNYRAYEGASNPPVTRRIAENGQFIEETYRLVYYGGGTDAQRARPIEVAPGSHVNAIDVSIAPGTLRARTIRGVVINGAMGQPAVDAVVAVVPHEPSPSIIVPMTRTAEDGSFALKGLTAEAYTLAINHRGAAPASAALEIAAGDGDMDNVAVTLRPSVSVSGRVTFESRLPDGASMDPSRINVQLRPEQGFPMTNFLPTPTTQASPDGRFTVTNVSPPDGTFTIGVSSLPPGVYVKSIRFGSADALNAPVRFASDPSATLEITLSNGMGTLDTLVLDAALKPSINALVVLVPEPKLRQRLDLYKARSTNTNGQLLVTDIVPGDYKLFAWDQIQTGAWLDAEVMKRYESLGKTIHVNEATKQTVELSVIRSTP